VILERKAAQAAFFLFQHNTFNIFRFAQTELRKQASPACIIMPMGKMSSGGINGSNAYRKKHSTLFLIAQTGVSVY